MSEAENQPMPTERDLAELTAALAVALPADQEQMPPSLRARLEAEGRASVRERRLFASRQQPRRRVLAWSGWMAAAALLLWVALPRETRAPEDSASVRRAALIERDSGAVRLAWSATGDSSSVGASGDVVWSETAQEGYMRFVGLKANDRQRFQYQLWIFDKARDERYPVDGGVFDIPPGQSEVVIPITSRLRVRSAQLFAVTVEPPGGVVVSTRERIALVAQRPG